MNQPIPENSHRQQPIPRSFFNDGQRAKYADRLGAIAVRAKEVMFIPLEQDGHEYTLLLGVLDTHFKWNNLELLDRTVEAIRECRRLLKELFVGLEVEPSGVGIEWIGIELHVTLLHVEYEQALQNPLSSKGAVLDLLN